MSINSSLDLELEMFGLDPGILSFELIFVKMENRINQKVFICPPSL